MTDNLAQTELSKLASAMTAKEDEEWQFVEM